MTNLKKALIKAWSKVSPSSNNSSSSENNSVTSKIPKLTIELVPSTCWFTNVRSEVSKAKWDKIRKKSYKAAGYKCEVCGDTGKNQGHNHPVECHEIWEYNDQEHTQTLVGFVSLCPNCHKCKHPGLAGIRGELEIVFNQLMKVNGMTRGEAEDYLAAQSRIWNERSEHQWELDISYIEEFLSE